MTIFKGVNPFVIWNFNSRLAERGPGVIIIWIDEAREWLYLY